MCHKLWNLPGSSLILTKVLNSHQSLSVKMTLLLTLNHFRFYAPLLATLLSVHASKLLVFLLPFETQKPATPTIIPSLAVLLHSTVAPLFRIPACTHTCSLALQWKTAVYIYIPVMTRWAECVPIRAPCAPLSHSGSFLNASTLYTALGQEFARTRLVFSAQAKNEHWIMCCA